MEKRSSSKLRLTQKAVLLATANLVIAGPLLGGCDQTGPEDRAGSSQQALAQATVDESAVVLKRLRAAPGAAALNASLSQARGVMIFPHVYKAAFVLGGAGGNGVLLSHDASGRWSSPGFYAIGAGSAGFQFGYEDATIVLVLMSDEALRSVIDQGLTLGAGASVAAGTLGDSGEARVANAARDVRQFVEVAGVFAGASLNGTIVAAREARNREYYKTAASTAEIVLQRRFDNPNAAALKQALSEDIRPGVTQPASWSSKSR